MRLSIAIDGPAGAGKSTIAKALAKKLNIIYINTGLMYRAVAYEALKRDIAPDNIEALCEMLDNIKMYFDGNNLILDEVDITCKLTSPEINKSVALYSPIAEIRERLVVLQREMSSKYDVVMDGRDIGTVVLPKAAFKFFVTASPEERAKRRYEELKSKCVNVTFEEVLKDQMERDFKDTTRKVNPLIKAEDAVEIDTTSYTIDEVVNIIATYIDKGLSSLEF